MQFKIKNKIKNIIGHIKNIINKEIINIIRLFVKQLNYIYYNNIMPTSLFNNWDKSGQINNFNKNSKIIYNIVYNIRIEDPGKK